MANVRYGAQCGQSRHVSMTHGKPHKTLPRGESVRVDSAVRGFVSQPCVCETRSRRGSSHHLDLRLGALGGGRPFSCLGIRSQAPSERHAMFDQTAIDGHGSLGTVLQLQNWLHVRRVSDWQVWIDQAGCQNFHFGNSGLRNCRSSFKLGAA